MFEIYFCFNPHYCLLLNFYLKFNIDPKTTKKKNAVIFLT